MILAAAYRFERSRCDWLKIQERLAALSAHGTQTGAIIELGLEGHLDGVEILKPAHSVCTPFHLGDPKLALRSDWSAGRCSSPAWLITELLCLPAQIAWSASVVPGYRLVRAEVCYAAWIK